MLIDDIHATLATINDPEMPISIVDLGIVDDVALSGSAARIRILPTFVGCPALDMLRDEIIQKTSALKGVSKVQVDFVFDPPWTPDRISAKGREDLRTFGVTVPQPGERAPTLVQLGLPQAVKCPYCSASHTVLQSTFGPTRCRMIYYCSSCKNQFEHMKPLPADLRFPPTEKN